LKVRRDCVEFPVFASKLINGSMDKCRAPNYAFLMHILKFVLPSLLFLTACASSSRHGEGHYGPPAPQFKYNELMLKDYDEMNKMVQNLLKKARAVGSNTSDENVDDQEAVAHLREALKLIFTRPNSDNMVAKLAPEVRRELATYNAVDRTLMSLANEGLATVLADNVAVTQQASALFMLENMLSEIRPEIHNRADLRKVVETIADADVGISSDVKKDMKLRGMFKAIDPSKLAREILNSQPQTKH
jgi:hypothetical protein